MKRLLHRSSRPTRALAVVIGLGAGAVFWGLFDRESVDTIVDEVISAVVFGGLGVSLALLVERALESGETDRGSTGAAQRRSAGDGARTAPAVPYPPWMVVSWAGFLGAGVMFTAPTRPAFAFIWAVVVLGGAAWDWRSYRTGNVPEPGNPVLQGIAVALVFLLVFLGVSLFTEPAEKGGVVLFGIALVAAALADWTREIPGEGP